MACHDVPTSPFVTDDDASAGSWRPWLLTSGSELRPAAPPAAGSLGAMRDIDEIIQLQSARTPAADSAVRRWSASPTAPWDSVALRTLDFYFPLLPDVRIATPVRAARAMALLNVAMYDALLATWDAKYVYRRVAPSTSDARVRTLAEPGAAPSYPSEHAAAGEAAAAVLSYLFPTEDTLAFHAMAREAGDSRILAGAAYRSDVDAGSTIGRAVAARVIARARADGAALSWTGTVPAAAGLWRPTPNKFVKVPFDANAGSWQTWVMSSGSAYRPLPPPMPGSAAFTRDLSELRTLSVSRTAAQADLARYWATDAPSVIWEKYMLRETAQRGLAPVRAARARALSSVAMYDAFVACWDAKFYYWLQRPVSADSSLRTVFPTPPFPSYPSGHSTISSAAAEVFADLFPDVAKTYRDKAVEASVSRVYAGVHYRFDVETGDSLGIRIGKAVAARARTDAAQP
jgi:membrane-associated phospholipid phosphatase